MSEAKLDAQAARDFIASWPRHGFADFIEPALAEAFARHRIAALRAAEPAADVAELVEELTGACTDWDGSEMADGGTPRSEPNCGDLRQYRDALTALARRVAELETELADAHHDIDRQMAIANSEANLAEELRAENARLREALVEAAMKGAPDD